MPAKRSGNIQDSVVSADPELSEDRLLSIVGMLLLFEKARLPVVGQGTSCSFRQSERLGSVFAGTETMRETLAPCFLSP